MDKLEEANNRLLARREQLKESTQTCRSKPLTLTISEIQALIEKKIKEPKPVRYCQVCGNTIELNLIDSNLCNSCLEKDRGEQKGKSEEEKQQYLRNCKTANRDTFLGLTGIPKRFMCVQSHEEKRSLFVTGAFGTGKTHYAIAAIKSYVDNLPDSCFVEPFTHIPVFITVPDLLLKIRSTFSLERCEEEIVDKYSNTPLFVLDDLGAEKTTEFSLQTLYIILNRRYNEQLQTIITSNLTLDEVKDKLGDRIASRIAGMCKVIELKGKDKRVAYAKQT